MRSLPARRSTLVLMVSMLLSLLVAAPGHAGPGKAVPWLALGDSLPYGWDPVNGFDPSDPPGPGVDPDFHHGYPEALASRSFLEVTNASCPGETSASFLSAAAPDNGCDFVRTTYGLKHDWAAETQLEAALAFLGAHPDTGLVTIQLGANDLFLCQADPVDGCTPGEFAAVLTAVGGNLAVTVGALRLAGYSGPIVLVGYYALDYTDPTSVGISLASRDVLHAVASAVPGPVSVADGFAAFEQASRRAGGDPCAAGLLLPRGDGTCDIHTSEAGDRVLAQALHRALDVGALASGR